MKITSINALQTGSILFGGVDTEKYTGNLTSVPIQRTSGTGSLTEFAIALTNLSVTGENGNTTTLTTSNFAESVVLDSGTTLSYLSDPIATSIFTHFDAVDASSTYGNVYINCDMRSTASHMFITYTFGTSGPTISVPISELIFDFIGVFSAGTVNGGSSTSQLQPFERTCAFGIQPAGNGGSLLGDTFLRSAYVVYDLKNDQISLAQTKFNTTESKIVELMAEESGVAGLKSLEATSISATTVVDTATGAQGLRKPTSRSSTTSIETETLTTAYAATTIAAAATSAVTSKAAAVGIRVPKIESHPYCVLLLAVLFLIGGGIGFLL